jgi:hypothetical protein
MHVSFCTALGECNQIMFVISLIFPLFSCDMGGGWPCLRRARAQSEEQKVVGGGGGAHFGCVVTGCIMVAKMDTTFVSARV